MLRTFTFLSIAALSLMACDDAAQIHITTTGGSGGSGGSGGAGDPPLSLAPGEAAELAVDGGFAGERLATPDGDERFVLIVASMDFVAKGPLRDYSVSLDAAPPDTDSPLLTGCSLSTDPWSTMPIGNEPPPTGTGPTQGDTRDIDVPTPTGWQTVPVQAVAVGPSAVVWADTDPAHPASLDPTFIQEFLADFEQTVLPRERSIFGVESDLDADGHIALVFSPLTYQTAVAFFTGCDLLTQLCLGTNAGEYLYLTPPNAIDPPYNTANAIKEILAHELSHMIHFNRKVVKNSLGEWNESSYMIEGIGGFAQDVSGYQAGNLYVTMAGLEGIADFGLGETLADGTAYDTTRDGVLRGGSYLFVRWLYDRAGGDRTDGAGAIQNEGGPSLLRTLLDDPDSIATALPSLVGASTEDIAADFYTALALSNRDDSDGVAPANGCFAYLPVQTDPITANPRGANVFASFHGQQMNGPAMQPAASADGRIRAGGVEYLTLDAAAGQLELPFSVQVDPAALPRVRVARIR